MNEDNLNEFLKELQALCIKYNTDLWCTSDGVDYAGHIGKTYFHYLSVDKDHVFIQDCFKEDNEVENEWIEPSDDEFNYWYYQFTDNNS